LCSKSVVSHKYAFDFCDWLRNERAPPPLADQCFLEHKAAQSSIVWGKVDEFSKTPRSHLKLLGASRVSKQVPYIGIAKSVATIQNLAG
jgi:hypothetical protein